MQLTISARAALKILSIIQEKGGGLALKITISRGFTGPKWDMTLHPATEDVIMVGSVPILADPATLDRLEGVVIDWIQTPEGPGFGVFDRNLNSSPVAFGRDAG